MNMDNIAAVKSFISAHWQETERFHPMDEGTLIGLPHPYIVPCRNGLFQELYYWDTYFGCLALWHLGEKEAILRHVRNFLFELNAFGFIPNGNRTYFLNRSQPPYFAALVRLLDGSLSDPALVREIVGGLAIEHRFWTEKRATPVGLSRHGHHATEAELLGFYDEVAQRAQLSDGDRGVRLEEAAHKLAEAESGWDFTPRFQHRCLDFCPVDLNSTLYVLESTLADMTSGSERTRWLALSEQRRSLVQTLCWDEGKQGFFDYDWRNGCTGPVVASSAFQPLWAGLATQEQAAATVAQILPQLECEYGIAACAPRSGSRHCQWDAPNLWPCQQTIVCRGLLRYGFREEARRIAGKYLDCVTRAFLSTGDLWEKYDAHTGAVQRDLYAGYTTPSMMGWTAGAFLDCAQLLEEAGTSSPSELR